MVVASLATRVRAGLKWRVLALLILLAAALSLTPAALRMVGTWLVVEDPLQPGRSVVVLGGGVPFRAIEAAAIYHQGWAREVWLTQGRLSEEKIAIRKLGLDPPAESVYNRKVLERMQVPGDAIRLLPERNVNTADEVRSIARALEAAGGERTILVTSKSHSRRVRVLWHALIGNRPEVVVRYTPEDPFQPQRWWRHTDDAMSVSREWFGLLNVWAGFPIESKR